MNALVGRMLDHLADVYGDLRLVTPASFANAIRHLGQFPDDASAFFIESWMSQYVTVRLNAAPPSVVGVHYHDGAGFVIETGRGRSHGERNISMVHEFGEILQSMINPELKQREQPSLDWGEREWDQMAVELLEPEDRFRRDARNNGLDVIELAKRLSYEATVVRLGEVFEQSVPLFAVHYRNDGDWERGRPDLNERWSVATVRWTNPWLKYGYDSWREVLRIPRPKEALRAGGIVAKVSQLGRAVLFHTVDEDAGRQIETDVLVRPKLYAGRPGAVFVVGVERQWGHLLLPQVQLLSLEERTGTFDQLF